MPQRTPEPSQTEEHPSNDLDALEDGSSIRGPNDDERGDSFTSDPLPLRAGRPYMPQPECASPAAVCGSEQSRTESL